MQINGLLIPAGEPSGVVFSIEVYDWMHCVAHCRDSLSMNVTQSLDTVWVQRKLMGHETDQPMRL